MAAAAVAAAGPPVTKRKRVEKKLKLPTVDPANAQDNVFFSIGPDVCIIHKLCEKHKYVFIRAGVAAGKSTMAQYLSAKFSNMYVLVERPKVNHQEAKSWISAMCSAYNRNRKEEVPHDTLDLVLASFSKNKKTLIFDEAHLLFECKQIIPVLFKPSPSYQNIRILLFSSSFAYNSSSYPLTPPEITTRLLWRPKMPPLDGVVQQLEQCDVRLDSDSVRFLFNICGGNFGVTVKTFTWVQQTQKPDSSESSWDFHMTLKQICISLQNGWSKSSFLETLATSRAVKVNSKYSDLREIPQEFMHVLFQGPTSGLPVKMLQVLTTAGFILPLQHAFKCDMSVKTNGLFSNCKWNDLSKVPFGVSRPLMIDYYRSQVDHFASKIKKTYLSKTPTSCLNLLLFAVPFLSFKNLFSGSIPIITKGIVGGKFTTKSQEVEHVCQSVSS